MEAWSGAAKSQLKKPPSHDLVILAIDTGSEFASVALGDPRSYSTIILKASRNSEELLRAADYLITKKNKEKIKAIAVCIGPGSYTGLRAGLATAQGLAAGMDLPLIAVSTFIAGLFKEKITNGDRVVGCRLRENETASCSFRITEKGAGLEQVNSVEFGQNDSDVVVNADAEGVLRAASTIKSFIPFSKLEPHYFQTSANEPIRLMYLKPVQAKTLLERGILQ